jgi:glycosyltransferase involved in cell wall biosynthesis
MAIRLNKQGGPSIARNIGISYTIENSDFYMVLDADDIMQPNKVYRCVEEAMKLPGIIGIVYGDYTTLNVENGIERIEYKADFDIEKLYSECIIHSGSLVSKEALMFAQDQYGFYDQRMRVAEDYDLWLRITRKYSAVHIPESLTTVRVTPKNSTNQVDIDTRNACHALMYSKLQGQQ